MVLSHFNRPTLWHRVWPLFWHCFWHEAWCNFWHLTWLLFWYFFWHCFWHAVSHCVWHLSDVPSGTFSGIVEDFFSDIAFHASFDMLFDIYSSITFDSLLDIKFGPTSDIWMVWPIMPSLEISDLILADTKSHVLSNIQSHALLELYLKLGLTGVFTFAPACLLILDRSDFYSASSFTFAWQFFRRRHIWGKVAVYVRRSGEIYLT